MAVTTREYYIANRERILARVKARAAAKADEIRAYKQAWHQKNRDEILAKKRAYLDDRREVINAKLREKYAVDAAYAEDRKARAKAYRKSKPDKATAAVRRWCDSNRDRLRSIKRAYSKRRPELGRKGQAERRARLASAFVEPVDYVQILRESNGLCGICREPLDLLGTHFDHIVPLARGGKHERANIQPAHAHCNLKKGARLPEELPWQ